MVGITIFRLDILASLQFIAGFQKCLLFSVAKFGYIGEGTESTACAFPLVTNKVIMLMQ